MRTYSLLVIICLVIFPETQCFLEEETLEGAVASLQIIVQNLQGQIKALQNQSCGCDIKAPVFMAALSNDITHCSKFQAVVFDSVKVNQGSGYDGSRGVFRAPVTGTYAFSATLSVMPHNEFHIGFVKGNVTNDIGYLLADPQNIWLQRSTTVYTHMNRNEEVWMVCLDDSRIEGDHNQYWGAASDYHSHFSGFLVTAD